MAATPSRRGTPVGRRIVVGMLGLGAVGIVVGAQVGNGIDSALSSVGGGDLVPGVGNFQIYTVTDGYPSAPPDYHLTVDGLVERDLSLTVDDLKAMPATKLDLPFQCVTGWRVPGVHWTGVSLAYLLKTAGAHPKASGVHFESFDGVYTESLSISQAKLSDVIVAYEMLDAPVTRAHGGPVRLYVAPMYGYKSIKWLRRISVTANEGSGYWENYGYDLNGWVGRSNGRTDAPIS